MLRLTTIKIQMGTVRLSVLLALCVVCIFFTQTTSGDFVPCEPKMFDHDSFVCVCNATHCDAVGRTTQLLYTYFNAFVTTRDGLRMDRQLGSWDDQIEPNEYVYMIGNRTFQTIMGFGGAITDAAAIAMSRLSEATRTKLINSYFEENGIEYTFGRIPMASCDFSERLYSYDETPDDFSLANFSLQHEDLMYKIPLIKQALQISKRNISFIGTPWTSPAWMKTNNDMTGKGTLKGVPGGPYYKTWAQYFVKFLQAYKYLGVDIWGLTIQNEPNDGLTDGFPFQCLGMTAELQRDFIANDLGPALAQAGFGDTKLMILDDERTYLPYWPEVILKDPLAAHYVSGIALHWYKDSSVPTVALDDTYRQFGDKYFLFNTEASEQTALNKTYSVELGNWNRGEHYFNDILVDLRHRLSGWMDWNIALDVKGGPNWSRNFMDSPIIVDADNDVFYKQPMFYAMGHYSKFFVPGSKVIEYHLNGTRLDEVEAIFVVREDNSIAANFLNKNDTVIPITITDPVMFGYLNFDLPAKSFVTFVWYRI